MTKNAIVTGGTRGIGKSIAVAMKEAGYNVVVNYASRSEVAEAFTKETGIPAVKWDVSDFEDCARGVKECEQVLGGAISILINNAGITRDAAMHKMDALKWNEVITTNLNSCFHMARVVIDSMREHNFGRIVNISSINGQVGQFGQTNYSAAKAGVLGFTKALARETAAKGITVNAIAPGYIRTDMTSAIREDVLEKIVAAIPVGRMGEPEEIARTVLFLIGEGSGFITGETISINGGQNME
ncbi:MAG: acetoacetyl-CoA reductase [Alphaproteobacteria bacterium]|nr:MAG: acetoacetyl-CoA reductase [Alphaproteobacteria bacterium]